MAKLYNSESEIAELNEARQKLINELEDAIGGSAPSIVRSIERFIDACIDAYANRRY